MAIEPEANRTIIKYAFVHVQKLQISLLLIPVHYIYHYSQYTLIPVHLLLLSIQTHTCTFIIILNTYSYLYIYYYSQYILIPVHLSLFSIQTHTCTFIIILNTDSYLYIYHYSINTIHNHHTCTFTFL